jgi:hypothetical protein
MDGSKEDMLVTSINGNSARGEQSRGLAFLNARMSAKPHHQRTSPA